MACGGRPPLFLGARLGSNRSTRNYKREFESFPNLSLRKHPLRVETTRAPFRSPDVVPTAQIDGNSNVCFPLRVIPQRALGKQGLKVGAIGYGAMVLEGWYGAIDETAAVDTTRHSLDHGVNLIGTADGRLRCK
jgi:hypothetical protein